jgi:hypothetical protein
MNEMIKTPPEKLERKQDLRTMTLHDLYENDCSGAVYWDLVRNAHLCKK